MSTDLLMIVLTVFVPSRVQCERMVRRGPRLWFIHYLPVLTHTPPLIIHHPQKHPFVSAVTVFIFSFRLFRWGSLAQSLRFFLPSFGWGHGFLLGSAFFLGSNSILTPLLDNLPTFRACMYVCMNVCERRVWRRRREGGVVVQGGYRFTQYINNESVYACVHVHIC